MIGCYSIRSSIKLFVIVFAGATFQHHYVVVVHSFGSPGLRFRSFRPATADKSKTMMFVDNNNNNNNNNNRETNANYYCNNDQCVRSTGRRDSITQMVFGVDAMLLSTSFPLLAFPVASRASDASNNKTKKPNKQDPPSIDPELSEAAQKLFDLDAPNRLVPNKEYIINVQGRKSKRNGEEDAAPNPLFEYVDPAVFEDRPTYRTFAALLDNYQPNVCLVEDDTKSEREEAYAFLRAAMKTPVLRFCYSFCRSRLLLAEQQQAATESQATPVTGSSSNNTNKPKDSNFDTEEDFIRLLYKIWFRSYSRSRGCETIDNSNGDSASSTAANTNGNGGQKRERVFGSSGFEHVFVGEIREGKVIGFHNWIQIHMQEKLGNVDYRGFVDKGSTAANANARVLTYNLQWMGAEKYLGTSFIGVSPEFELALYTMMFLVGKKDNIIRLDLGTTTNTTEQDRVIQLDVKCFKTKGKVGSCYVESMLT